MQVGLQSIHVKNIWSIAWIIAILLLLDLIMRIYLNYLQIKEIHTENNYDWGTHRHGVI